MATLDISPITHQNGLDEDTLKKPGLPPTKPFEVAGFETSNLTWKNRGIARPRFPFNFPQAHHPRLQEFRERYSFLDAIKDIDDEWEQIKALRNWVHRQIPWHYDEKKTLFGLYHYQEVESDPFKILDYSANGAPHWCTYYAKIFHAVLSASGWVSRHVGNRGLYKPDGKTGAHGVNDVFVNSLGKWVYLDSMFDYHFSKDGVLLSTWEAGEELAKNDARDVEVFKGRDSELIKAVGVPAEEKYALHQNYWSKIALYQDCFNKEGPWTPRLNIIKVGKRHEGHLCTCGNVNATPDAGYEEGFTQHTTRDADIYPDIGTSRIEIAENKIPGTVKVNIGTYTPNLKTFLLRIDNREWQPSEAPFVWHLHDGDNTLEVRTENAFGRLGHPSKVSVNLTIK